jgi:hypothetical protein
MTGNVPFGHDHFEKREESCPGMDDINARARGCGDHAQIKPRGKGFEPLGHSRQFKVPCSQEGFEQLVPLRPDELDFFVPESKRLQNAADPEVALKKQIAVFVTAEVMAVFPACLPVGLIIIFFRIDQNTVVVEKNRADSHSRSLFEKCGKR